ncbi:MAG: hypothetical protein H0W89_03325 [Candidatus Levybacteria bacterium]|nr:hypothetical protein [Candidatus Levybacteria bacterium]
MTGKIAGDSKILSQEVQENTHKRFEATIDHINHSRNFQAIISYARKQWLRLMRIPLFSMAFLLMRDNVLLFIRYYGYIFIIFAICFPSIVILLNLWENAHIYFFLTILPILLFISFCTAVLYFVINHHQHGEKISLWNGFAKVLPTFSPLASIVIIQFTVIVLAGVTFLLFAISFRFFFEALALSWSSSFVYWFFTVLLGLSIASGLFFFSLVMHQAFFLILLESKSFNESVYQAKHIVKTYSSYTLFFCLLLYLFLGAFIYWSFLFYLYGGLFISLFLSLQTSLYLGYILRNTMPTPLAYDADTFVHTKQILTIIALFGLVNYVLVSSVVITQFYYITSNIEKLRNNYFLSEKLAIYSNPIYGFRVGYPPNWSMYEWRGSSVTFYNNYTGTLAGGIWMNISVSPYVEGEFERLFNVRPGLVSLDNTTHDVTTKVTNITVDEYRGVNYTYFKKAEPYSEYQTHYLIHHGQYVFDIKFTTLDKDVEGNNTDLFEKIVASFTFTEE